MCETKIFPEGAQVLTPPKNRILHVVPSKTTFNTNHPPEHVEFNSESIAPSFKS